uniref:Macoilin n=1 Tax=Pavo cristatus TaxID=9049 RepID=A0A8C9L142_PAVCR
MRCTFLYLKFLVVWALVLLADFVLEFRFEYLWPFWLFIRSVYDSFRYQGLAFSVFFVCVAFTSNIICLLFIPIQWLFFAASTYVWVQYVWHTERGVCLPTVSLWILFVYIEAAIRFKDLKNFHVDLCRPFAAHCIGYPVVSLGFGFKSYVSYKMRLRKQKEVQKENEFYMQLLQQALPPEQQMLQRQEREAEEAKGLSEMDSSMLLQHNGGIPANKKLSATLPELEYREKGKEKDKDAKKHNLGINNNILQPVDSKIQEIEYMENHINSKRLNNDLVGSTENLLKEDSCTASSKNYKNVSGVVNSSPRSHSATNGSIPSASTKNEKKQKCPSKSPSAHKDLMENCIPNNQLSKPDALVRLEQDIKKLKADLQASRQIEQELRSQISSLTNTERGIRSEIGQLRQENELLQNKLHNTVQMKQKDKQMISQLEKKLKAEQEARAFVEKQLMEEKKRKKLEEATAARAVAFAAATRGECTETLRNRIRELETECKKLSIDIKLKEDQIRELEMKVQELRKYKENEKDTEVLMSALSAMQDKTQHLENSLSAETRIKLDLFSALGDAKRQLEIAQGNTQWGGGLELGNLGVPPQPKLSWDSLHSYKWLPQSWRSSLKGLEDKLVVLSVSPVPESPETNRPKWGGRRRKSPPVGKQRGVRVGVPAGGAWSQHLTLLGCLLAGQALEKEGSRWFGRRRIPSKEFVCREVFLERESFFFCALYVVT